MSVNIKTYTLGSAVLSGVVIWNAYVSKAQFYTTCVHLATSKASMMVLGNMVFCLFLLFASVFKTIFLGTLRDVEVEHLTDKIWTTMMDALLIMTIFRDEFTPTFVGLFVVFLFVKTFHWLSQDRVDFLQQTPHVPKLTHIRIFTLMVIMLVIDIVFVYIAAETAVDRATKAPTMMVFFGFEYLILVSNILCTICKYFLNIIDMQREGRWENKGAYVLYLEFFTDMFRLAVYVVFFSIILTYYGIPLHIIRQLYYTFTSFKRRVAEVIRYRKATHNMNTRFPNATPEELQAAETCIVCREELNEGKKLPCGHILHLHCLRSWLERQQVCPICRTPVLQEELPQNMPQQQPAMNQFPPNWWNAMHPMMPAPGMDMPNWAPQPQVPRNANNAENAEMQDNQPMNEDISDLDPNMQFALQQIESMQFQITSVARQLELLHGYLVSQARNGAPAPAPTMQQQPVRQPNQTQQPQQSPQQPRQSQQQPNDFDLTEDEELARAIEESKKVTASTMTTTTTTTTTTSSTSLSSSQNSLSDSQESPASKEKEDPERSELRKRWALRYSQQ